MNILFQKDRHLCRPTTVIFCVLLILGVIVFYVVKFQNSVLLERLYEQGKFDLLNRMTGVTEGQPVEFYLGRAQETFFGPASQILGGLLFAAFALYFLRGMKLKFFGLSVFCYLIITKFEVLFFPPYGDAIGGPFAEAIWLARNSFDYIGLFKQAGYAIGGPKVYFFSIYPTYLALLLKLIPIPKLFLIINHLVVFAFASTIVALLKSILARFFHEDISILGALLLLSLPLFQGQTEAINMEMPSAFFGMLSAYYLINKRVHLSGTMAVCAVLVKGSAIFTCGAFFLVSLYLFFLAEDMRFNKKFLWWGAGLVILAVAKLSSKFFINDQHVSAGMVGFAQGWPSLNHMYIFFIYVVSLIIGIAFYFYRRFRGRLKDIDNIYVLCVMWVYGAMWFALFFNFFAVSPRYRVLAYPFVVFTAIYAFSSWVRFHFIQKWILIGALIVSLFSSYGYFYGGSVPGNYHVILERSLEYRNDLKLNQHVAKIIEDKYAGYKIGAPFVIAQLLALPELGYVQKNLDVMIYGFPCKYGGIETYPGMGSLDITKVMYVATQVGRLNGKFFPIHPNDKIIEEVKYGNKKLWLFMGGIGIERVFRAINLMRSQGNK